MQLNKVFLFGNLTRDPEERALPSGAKVVSFSLATSRVWKDQNGAKKEDTQFHNIVVFGRQADLVAQYLRKGSSALVEGRLQTRSWDSADGTKKYRTEIVADRVQFGPRPSSSRSVSAGEPEISTSPEVVPTVEYPEENINPDDIPF